MKKLVHKHLLVKAYIKNPPMSEEDMNLWFLGLVSDVGMKVCIAPRSNYVDISGNRGITGQIGLSTSHASMHVWDEQSPSMIQMDLYSCGEYDPETVINKLNEFGIISYELMLIDREDGFQVLDHKKVTL